MSSASPSKFSLKPKPYLPFWILAVLFIVQTVAVCFTHCLTARLALCDAVLLVVVMAARAFECHENARTVLRLAGLISFEGFIFVNLTHATEMLIQRHDEGVHLKGLFIGLTLVDIFVKLIMMCGGILPKFDLKFYSQLVLHFSATSATLMVVLLGYVKHDEGIILKADPIFTIVTCTALSVAAFPALCQSLRLLSYDIPDGFKVEEFKNELNAKFSKISCDHLHIYKTCMDNSFNAFLSITYRCSMDDPQWKEKVQMDITKIQKEIRSALTKAGGKMITIQPRVVDETLSTAWDFCIDDDCRKKSCC